MTKRGRPRWLGMPGHFIGAYECCFRLHTHVGRYCVSTVGCYHPSGRKDPHPLGPGPEELFETMVFRLGAKEKHVNWRELRCVRYRTQADAEAGHARVVEEQEAAGEERMKQ